MTLLLRFLIACLLLVPSLLHAQVQVQAEANALRLARHLVGNGVAIQNASFTGGSASAGFFVSRGTNGVGIDSGLVLTNGHATSVPGAATGLASNALDLPGDALLTALAGKPTSDACVLEFDFVPMGDTLRFRYVFSSEEYPEYVCSEYNDVFAFLLSGPGIPTPVNLALVPGTNIPVTINSINNGTPGIPFNLATCRSMGPGAPFTRLYVDNLQGTSLRHNGRTAVLEAVHKVTPCQTYHIRLVIADAGGTATAPDRTYDSGVFLEARSFSAGTLSLVNLNPVDNGQPFLAEGCRTGGFDVRSSIPVPATLTLPIVYTGGISPGDLSALPVSVTIPAGDSVVRFPLAALADNLPEGTEPFKVFLGGTCPNSWADSLLVEIRDYDTVRISPGSPLLYCTEGTPLALQVTSGYSSYQWTPAGLFNNATISNPVVQATDNVQLQLLATDGPCRHRDSVLLLRKKISLRGKRDASCAGRSDGEINIGAGPLWTPPLLFATGNRGWTIDSNMYFLPPGDHTVYLRDATGCIDSLIVNIGQKPDPQLRITVQEVPCAGVDGQILVAATGGSTPYYWSIDGLALSSATVFNRPAGTYQVLLSDFYQCTAQATVTIGVMPTPQVQFVTTPATCLLDGRLTVSGPAGMEYSLNFAPYQSSTTSFALPPGQASLRARHHPACVQIFNAIIPLQSDLQWSLLHADTLCEGTRKQLLLQSNANSYRWSGPSLSADTVAAPLAAPVRPSMYYVTATRGNCSKRDSVELFVRAAPAANAGADTAICQGDRATLHGSGGTRFRWMPAGSVSNPAAADPQVRPLTTTAYWTSVTNNYGCISLQDDTVEVRVVPPVRAYAGRDTVIAKGQPLQLEGYELSNSGVTQYHWSPNLWLSSDTVAQPIALPAADITYLLTLRTPEGCSGTARIKVKLFADADIYVPTAFTPNGDGKNDRLRAIPVGMRSFHYFRVFNRWGAVVFETRDAALGWDGTVRGQQQDSNVYIWVAEGVDYRGNAVLRKGSVLLLH